MKFNDFYWHDATLKGIHIDRNNPGINDLICFEIQWPGESEKVNFIFENVYSANLDLNSGVVTDETILSAFELEEDAELIRFYAKWKDFLKDIKLKLYKIELNSTGSEIKIIAEKFRVEN